MKKVAQTVIVADRFYTIANASGKVIEGVEGEANGAAIQLGIYAHKPNQEWAFIRVGEGAYRIKNRGTGKMMDLMMGGSADGTWLHQWEDANSSSQMWIVEPTNDGQVKIKAQLAPAKCVDVVNMSTEAGARLQIWQDVNGENQIWKIAEVVEKKPRARKPAAEKAEEAAEAPKKRSSKPSAKKAEEAAAAAVEPKKRTRKPAAKKAEETAAATEEPKKRTRKPAAKKTEEAAVAEAPKKRGRKPAAKKAEEQPSE